MPKNPAGGGRGRYRVHTPPTLESKLGKRDPIKMFGKIVDLTSGDAMSDPVRDLREQAITSARKLINDIASGFASRVATARVGRPPEKPRRGSPTFGYAERADMLTTYKGILGLTAGRPFILLDGLWSFATENWPGITLADTKTRDQVFSRAAAKAWLRRDPDDIEEGALKQVRAGVRGFERAVSGHAVPGIKMIVRALAEARTTNPAGAPLPIATTERTIRRALVQANNERQERHAELDRRADAKRRSSRPPLPPRR